jgi:hypothetical protein
MIKNLPSKHLHDLRKGGLARFDEFAGNQVGIDDRNAKGCEFVRHSGLAAGDAPCQSDPQDGSGHLDEAALTMAAALAGYCKRPR